MLSIVAVMFVLVARMDSIATSNIADNKMLDLAAKSIIEIISNDLVLDVPGAANQEYYDYPDACDAWLANIEPYESGGNYYWRQISDIGYLSYSGRDTQIARVPEYSNINVVAGVLQETLADADGDGIADSKWFELTDLHTSKGKPICAAVRVIDNSAMINVNTAHHFDSNNSDGTSQMQINLNGLKKGTDDIADLNNARGGNLADYEKNIIWGYVPTGNYTPFDISDELELRYRYCIDSKVKARIENIVPDTAHLSGSPDHGMLYDGTGIWRLNDWKRRITDPYDPEADRRHLLTTLNLDRLIDPCGVKMTNINNANVYDINNMLIKMSFTPDIAAQIAVNIIDYRDSNSDVTTITDGGGTAYYGFERPCVYISELAYQYDGTNQYYAVELYKPYPEDSNPAGWNIRVGSFFQHTVNWGSGQFYVLAKQGGAFTGDEYDNISFVDKDMIFLTRTVDVGGTPTEIVVDSVVPAGFVTTSAAITNSIKRDITQAKCIRRLWGPIDNNPSLGNDNTPYTNVDSIYIQAHPKNGRFTNIGEIGMILRKPAYYPLSGINNGVIGYNNANNTEPEVFINLADPCFQQIFKYLTVWPPSYANQNETRIKGRININTAPAFVIAQLPWVSLREGGYDNNSLAKAIVAYKDKTGVPTGDPNYDNRPGDAGFQTIGQLCDVCDVNSSTINYGINYYGLNSADQLEFPDLDPNDGAIDDFEERDLIFARISNLVTVRSDIFTAYILVRVCTNVKSDGTVEGPQKRYSAIIDRSNVKNVNDKPVIKAFQTVPEAR
jgi:hypothetical protein